jgi:transposase InsO family protein
MNGSGPGARRDAWGRFRFSIIGPLLAAPPERGALVGALDELAARTWKHPLTGAPVSFSFAVIERWYYVARNAKGSPVRALRPRLRKDSGASRALSVRLLEQLAAQHKEHPGWSFKLHADNLRALVAADATLGPAPSYPTVRRAMRARGWLKTRRVARNTAGARLAAERLEQREVRSFEIEYVHGLWHFDFHAGSRKVLRRDGCWATAHMLGVLDDCSRVCCHGQWYFEETAEALAHGLSQGIQKHGLPRTMMSDNGAAMLAAEIERGFEDLGILHETTLPYSPYQNAKQECFWGQVEGRLLAMLEGCAELTLELLNNATCAWIEQEYHRTVHRELGVTPLARYLAGPEVGRPSPSSDDLRRAFRAQVERTQRRSDGTISLEGRRYEIPNAYRHLQRVTVRYARWDLGAVDLVDPRSGAVVAPLYPLDKAKNADGRRRALDPPNAPTPPPARGMAPLLRQLIGDYAATGLPPAYLPFGGDDEE